MSEKFDVIALGELLIDFTENGVSSQGNPIFEANPGGAPCNVLAMLNKLGKKTSFLGVVGKDQFGVSLRAALEEQNIDTSHLYEDPEVHTTLAFVHTFEDGDRDFAFYRNPGADMMLNEDQIDEAYITSARVQKRQGFSSPLTLISVPLCGKLWKKQRNRSATDYLSVIF